MMTTAFEEIEIANQFLTGLRTGDRELLQSIMADDVVWNLPGSSLPSEEAQGVEAVIQRAQHIVRHGLIFTLRQMLFGRHGVALSFNNTTRRGSLILDEHLTVLRIREGKICAIDTYWSDVDLLNPFFLPK
jgi:ketosteroid isomerase-like protein